MKTTIDENYFAPTPREKQALGVVAHDNRIRECVSRRALDDVFLRECTKVFCKAGKLSLDPVGQLRAQVLIDVKLGIKGFEIRNLVETIESGQKGVPAKELDVLEDFCRYAPYSDEARAELSARCGAAFARIGRAHEPFFEIAGTAAEQCPKSMGEIVGAFVTVQRCLAMAHTDGGSVKSRTRDCVKGVKTLSKRGGTTSFEEATSLKWLYESLEKIAETQGAFDAAKFVRFGFTLIRNYKKLLKKHPDDTRRVDYTGTIVVTNRILHAAGVDPAMMQTRLTEAATVLKAMRERGTVRFDGRLLEYEAYLEKALSELKAR